MRLDHQRRYQLHVHQLTFINCQIKLSLRHAFYIVCVQIMKAFIQHCKGFLQPRNKSLTEQTVMKGAYVLLTLDWAACINSLASGLPSYLTSVWMLDVRQLFG